MSTQPKHTLAHGSLVDAGLSRALPGVSPAGLLEAIENADAITGTARGFLYINLHTLQQLSNSPSFTTSHRLQYAALLAKIGKVIGADVADGAGVAAPNVNIVFEQSSSTETRPHISASRPALTVVQPTTAGGAEESFDALPDFSDLERF
jgi:hypothetical protein